MNEAELSGRTILITGGSRGIGLAVGEQIAALGGRVIAVGRDRDRVEAAVKTLPGRGHLAHPMDVSEPEAWAELIGTAKEAGGLDGLVTAAGVLEPIGPTASVDPEEVLAALRVNLWGTFLAIHHALPALVAAEDGAIVTLSGGGATGPLPRYDAYAISKAAVVRLTENVAADEPRVRVNAVAPGFVGTEIHRATLAAGAELAGASYYERTRRRLEEDAVPPELAAELVSLLLGDGAAGITGKLISAVWDPWGDPAFRARLVSEPDLCTLRRIDGRTFGPLAGRE